MTLNQIFNSFRSIAANHINIYSFSDNGYAGLGQEVKEYPLLSLKNEGATINADTITHQFIVAVTSLQDSDQSNTVNVQSDCFDILNDVMIVIDTYEQFSEIDIVWGSIATPIFNGSSDNTAGYSVNLSLTIPRIREACVAFKCD